MKNYAIILASGTGSRSGLSIPKQFLKVAGKTIFEHTLDAFEQHGSIDHIFVICPDIHRSYCHDLIIKGGYTKISKLLSGGETRQQSSYIGLSAIEEKEAKVMIHDAVRPFINDAIISDVIRTLEDELAIDVAIPTADTLIEIDEHLYVKNIPDRSHFMRGQTPQAFRLSIIKKAHQMALEHQDFSVTDDCGLVLKYNLAPIKVIQGNDFNHKITYPVDVAIADKLFQLKTVEHMSFNANILSGKVMMIFGAGQGIGEACLELAKKHQARVYGFTLTNGTDITNEESVRQAFASVLRQESSVDAVIVTAGVLNMGRLDSRSMNDIRSEIDVNYFGNIIIAQQAYQALKASKGSLTFFTSSSYTRGRSLYATYSSIKAALVNLTQALAEEWQPDHIRVNIMNPQRTATPMRSKNFGSEPAESLLSAAYVAEKTLATAFTAISGQVIEIKKH